MKYSINGSSTAHTSAHLDTKPQKTSFGITPEQQEGFSSPADLFLGAFASCILKNIERFSILMKFEYERAEIEVSSTRLEKPPRMDQIDYTVTIYSNDEALNKDLLQRNIEKFGTIYNTVAQSCTVQGEIMVVNA